MKKGFVYGFIHPQSPSNEKGKVRVKVGRSGRHPWGTQHEQRGEKLSFAFELFGFERPENFFEPFETHDSKGAEEFLKAHCRKQGWSLGPSDRGRSRETFLVPEKEALTLRKLLEERF